MHHLIRKFALLAVATATTTTAAVLPTPSTQAVPRLIGTTEFGVRFEPDGDPGQCGGRQGEQWHLNGEWSDQIQLDTDDRPGGCRLAFGIYDPQNQMRDASVRYAFQSAPGAGPGQCGNEGDYRIPTSSTARTFGPAIRIDTDSRPGGCTLTFLVSNTPSVTLDIRYAGDGDVRQCGGALPNDLFTASPGHPVALTVDTDNRPGGCRMQLRLNI
ncbi:hypothetical protein [Kitasatospora griseola]|uniref:hypothetical protein n=1 Tax=Kitasatospora griseola TaxID=2064 RepID=UPI00381960CA